LVDSLKSLNMKRALLHAWFFLQEFGRQDDYLFSGIGAPCEKAHWFKTRKWFKTSWLYATLRCDIRFNTL